MNPETLLKELIESIGKLTFKGTSIRLMDSRRNNAMMDAERYFNRKGIHLQLNPRARTPVDHIANRNR